MSLAKNWCFTKNNYTDEDLAVLAELPCKYLIYGKEVAPTTGTPHLQGYLQMEKKIRMAGLKKLFEAHYTLANGSADQNIAYCSKEGDVFEKGQVTRERQRSELENFKNDVKSGLYDRKRLREEHSLVCAKYPRFVEDYLRDHRPEPELPNHPLQGWQEDLNQTLNLEPDDRSVMFIVDVKGGAGKTWFAKYYSRLHDNAQVMEMGRKADMAYALREDIRVLFVNCTRSQNEFMNYSFLESVKDGMVFSSKYESGMKRIGPCHVVVLMNERPDKTKLSLDRYRILDVEGFEYVPKSILNKMYLD